MLTSAASSFRDVIKLLNINCRIYTADAEIAQFELLHKWRKYLKKVFHFFHFFFFSFYFILPAFFLAYFSRLLVILKCGGRGVGGVRLYIWALCRASFCIYAVGTFSDNLLLILRAALLFYFSGLELELNISSEREIWHLGLNIINKHIYAYRFYGEEGALVMGVNGGMLFGRIGGVGGTYLSACVAEPEPAGFRLLNAFSHFVFIDGAVAAENLRSLRGEVGSTLLTNNSFCNCQDRERETHRHIQREKDGGRKRKKEIVLSAVVNTI